MARLDIIKKRDRISKNTSKHKKLNRKAQTTTMMHNKATKRTTHVMIWQQIKAIAPLWNIFKFCTQIAIKHSYVLRNGTTRKKQQSTQ